MELHDLVAHRKTDAGAPGLGAALVKFLFDQRKLVLRDAGAMVPDADHNHIVLTGNAGLDPLAVLAVLGGIVQNVQEHLAQALGIAGNLRNLLVIVQVFQGDAVLGKPASVHEYGIFKLAADVRLLHGKGHPAILEPGKVQQLHHHFRQPFGLRGNDLQALDRIGLQGFIGKQSFAPAVDHRQRGAQLMGKLGDELRLHFFVLTDLDGHFIDGIRQVLDFVVVFGFDLRTVAAVGDPLCLLRDLLHRGHDGTDEKGTGKQND